MEIVTAQTTESPQRTTKQSTGGTYTQPAILQLGTAGTFTHNRQMKAPGSWFWRHERPV